MDIIPRQLALTTHLAGVIIWLGGLIATLNTLLAMRRSALAAATESARQAQAEGSAQLEGSDKAESVSKAIAAHSRMGIQAVLQSVRHSLITATNAGLLLAWIGGLAMLLPNFTTMYAKAGWMHGKLTIALILSALTGVLGAKVKKALNDDKALTHGFMMGVYGAVALCMILVLALVFYRPGSA